MECYMRPRGKIACAVRNYGDPGQRVPGPGDAAGPALDATIRNDVRGQVAIVAMEYDPSMPSNKTRFYVFNELGHRLTAAALDSEGAKEVPGVCIACHGGRFDPATNTVVGAKFLPFDLDNFKFSTAPGWTRADQEDEFRKLNEIVYRSGANAATRELIEGWYDDGTGQPDFSATGPAQKSDFVAAGWASNATVYKEVIKPYCRTCHVVFNDTSSPDALDFDDAQDLADAPGSSRYTQLTNYVCGSKIMPHAEVTRQKFWQSPARAHLVSAFNLKTACD